MGECVKNNQPVYLNLFQFKFPATAIASILHRLSGVILFLFLPVALWMLSYSLQGEEQFADLKACLMSPWVKWFWAAVMVALFYHLIAGIRHIIMDMGFGDGKASGRIGAYTIIIITLVFAGVLGVCIW